MQPMVTAIYSHLPRARLPQTFLVLCLMLVSATAELVTVGAVLPFLSLLANPERPVPWIAGLVGNLDGFDQKHLLFLVSMLFVCVAIIAGMLRVLLVWATNRLVYSVAYDFGATIYRKIMSRPYIVHINTNSSEAVAAFDKVQLVAGGVMLPALQALSSIIMALFIFCGLLIIDPFVSTAALFALGCTYASVSYLTRKRLGRNSQGVADGYRDRVKHVHESLSGIRDIILDGTEKIFQNRFNDSYKKYQESHSSTAFISSSPRFVIEAVGIALIAALATYAYGRDGTLDSAIPALGALALGAQRLLPLLQQIYHSWAQIAGNTASLRGMLDLLSMPDSAGSRDNETAATASFHDKIELHDVSFVYTGAATPSVDSLSIAIPRGAKVAFIGKTGSGKTTAADLMMGLLPPTNGHITIDGRVLTPGNIRSWQSQIAHVPQSIFLADASVGQNIAFGVDEPKIDWNRVKEAASKARLYDFIESLPSGFQTGVGERGVRLSGGQRQRIGIARALYKNAKVLFFDEATSALDTETENSVMESILALGPDLTVVIIAHRLSTVMMCDTIYRLERGRLLEWGSPRDVISKGAPEETNSEES